MEKRVEIDKGSNEHLKWSEALYEDDKFITYVEWGYGEVLRTMPGIDDDIEYIVKIKKIDLGDMTFDKLLFILLFSNSSLFISIINCIPKTINTIAKKRNLIPINMNSFLL